MVSVGLCYPVGGSNVVVVQQTMSVYPVFHFSFSFSQAAPSPVLLTNSFSFPPPRPFLPFPILLWFMSLFLTHPRVPPFCLSLSLSPQVDSIDNFTSSNTPSREDDPKSHLKSRSRSPSMASDMEPIEVRTSRHLTKRSNLPPRFARFPHLGTQRSRSAVACFVPWTEMLFQLLARARNS